MWWGWAVRPTGVRVLPTEWQFVSMSRPKLIVSAPSFVAIFSFSSISPRVHTDERFSDSEHCRVGNDCQFVLRCNPLVLQVRKLKQRWVVCPQAYCSSQFSIQAQSSSFFSVNMLYSMPSRILTIPSLEYVSSMWQIFQWAMYFSGWKMEIILY